MLATSAEMAKPARSDGRRFRATVTTPTLLANVGVSADTSSVRSLRL
jgi:hypothetical protein